jgi:hypothetical protein
MVKKCIIILFMIKNVDVSVLQVSIVEKLSELPHMSKVGIPCVLTDIEASRYG